MQLSKKAMTAASAFGAVALLAVGVTSASAVVTTAVDVDNATKTWSVDPVIADVSGTTTIPVSGSGFDGFTLVVNGIYIAYGGADFTSQDSSYYADAVWASPTATSATETRVVLSGGAFSGASIDVVQSYNEVDCYTDVSDTTGEQCYIYTFSGWGAYPDQEDDPNFTQVPVYFE
ncbi:hypothetical protein N8K70_15740 [Microbacterium betulae]|uniref:Htaa domain-containing protein n=1 Tax=Microbacterium betulae TaxID=2981139 RepID=A0AA97FG34_9MICO|nr:hypothetical protein [Microbacterium sp. AB]WOF22826.1 hypothetical protein N8K70_15740 [Microbacterium sp. AB]